MENKGQVKPGEVRNPKGRPKTHDSLAEIIRRTGEKTKDKDTRTRWETLAEAMFDEAENGNVKAASFLADRAFGKPIAVELTGKAEDKDVFLDPSISKSNWPDPGDDEAV